MIFHFAFFLTAVVVVVVAVVVQSAFFVSFKQNEKGKENNFEKVKL